MNKFKEMKRNYIPEIVNKLTEDELQWFRDDKFGMFIHWGLYSILGKGEWVMFNKRIGVSEYARLAEDFKTEEFEPKAWARTAKAAGMKYMVLTARHHDGFCLFDSKVSDFTTVKTAAKRDIVKEYVEACRGEGLKVGIYYSPMDWRFPGYFFPELYHDNAIEMKQQCWSQIIELMTNYGKIHLLWFDGEWLAHGGINWLYDQWCRKEDWGLSDYTRTNYFWESEKLINRIRELQPGIVVNNRSGWTEGDFHSRERRIGDIRTDKPWEACDTIGGSWGWCEGKATLSLKESIDKLVSAVTRDGNFLLNIGPRPSGVMDEHQVNRLGEIGNWLNKYGEAIYNTRGGPFIPGEWGGATYRGNKIYIHIIKWAEEAILLPNIENKLVSCSSPSSNRFHVQQLENSIVISVHQEDRDLLDTIILLEFENVIEWEGIVAKEDDIYGLADGLGNE